MRLAVKFTRSMVAELRNDYIQTNTSFRNLAFTADYVQRIKVGIKGADNGQLNHFYIIFSQLSWILKLSKTMPDKLMYISNNDTQNCPFCKLQLVVETFRHSN